MTTSFSPYQVMRAAFFVCWFSSFQTLVFIHGNAATVLVYADGEKEEDSLHQCSHINRRWTARRLITSVI